MEMERCLGVRDEPLPPDHMLISEQTTVYARPDTLSFDWASLPRGAMVKLERKAEGRTQATYQELDRWPDTSYVTYRITGWVANSALTAATRHFYQLEYRAPTEDMWEVEIDYHRFTLFWAPLDDLPTIMPPQDGWVVVLREKGTLA